MDALLANPMQTSANLYSPLPRSAPQPIFQLMERYGINKKSAEMVSRGVPLPVVRQAVANKVALGEGFVKHSSLPKNFVVGKVNEVLSTGDQLVVGAHEGNLFYFTLSDRGLNIRNQEQWLEQNFPGL
ncbi:hypothetical protein [Pseudomonas sichuanensis]|uniref:Uncharacterized protein n=1 Tax=Pseudomonas sichuanensis TaxID=2213015 RepID=A0ABV0DP28_9PSED